MLPYLRPISSLLAGIALLLLGTGLLNTLLALRGSLEGFSDQSLGLIGSAYFIGFILGTKLCPKLIRQMGHVRAFAFFAAAAASCVLAHVLFVNEIAWVILRIVTGIALVGFYTVIESWLNSSAPQGRRAQVFSIYMAVNLFALAGAQQFLRIDSPSSFTLFAIAAIFVIVALMPVVSTRLPPPVVSKTPGLPLRKLWDAAPVACAGGLASGLAMGAFWALGAVYAVRMGMDGAGVGTFITIVILAGAVMQWPMGLLSDRVDRRTALAAIAGLAALGGILMSSSALLNLSLLPGAFVFGGAAFAVYPVVVAHLIDHLQQDDILSGNAGLLMIHGIGAAVGPALAGLLMGWFGPNVLPIFFALMFGPAALFALLVSRHAPDLIVEEAAHFIPMLRTSPTALEMMTPETDEVTATEVISGETEGDAPDDAPASQEPAGMSPNDQEQSRT